MTHVSVYRFPVSIGEKVNDNDMVAVGGEGGWITRLSCPENQRAVLEGMHFFKQKIPQSLTHLGHMVKDKTCNAYFEGLHFDTNIASIHGLYVTLQIKGNSAGDCEIMKQKIEKEARFFITGDMEVTWHKSEEKGTADTPQITGFSIVKFGYFTAGSRAPRIVFDTF